MCVCVLEPYGTFPVELIISFFHFHFFFISSSWEIRYKSVECILKFPMIFFLTLIHSHYSLPWPIFPMLPPSYYIVGWRGVSVNAIRVLDPGFLFALCLK